MIPRPFQRAFNRRAARDRDQRARLENLRDIVLRRYEEDESDPDNNSNPDSGSEEEQDMDHGQDNLNEEMDSGEDQDIFIQQDEQIEEIDNGEDRDVNSGEDHDMDQEMESDGSNNTDNGSDENNDRSDTEDNESNSDESDDNNADVGAMILLNREEIGPFIRDEIREWALGGGIMSMEKLNALLKRLHRGFQEVPLSYKTLLHTPINIQTENFVNALELWYKGIRSNLSTLDLTEYLTVHGSIELDISMDGLPLFKRSEFKFWVILGKLTHTKNKPFIIAIFFGKREPNTQELCQRFSVEKRDLETNGFNFNGHIYNFKIRNYICDAPARAKAKNIIEHGGAKACEKCFVEGEWIQNRMTYIDINQPLRTDASFINQDDPDHHKGDTPLATPDWKPVSSFRLDPLHLVDLGVFRRLLLVWKQWNGPWKLSIPQWQGLDNDIAALKPSCPSDFNRKPRRLSKLSLLTGKELRQFLLYSGVVLFRDHQNVNVYKHFLLLHSAMCILRSPVYYRVKNEIAVQALRLFITHSVHIYGEAFVVYNVHNLAHLGQECLQCGPCDDFSSYPFESRLGQIKRLLKSGYKPLKQVANRDLERPETDVILDRREFRVQLAMRHYPEEEIIEGTFFKYVTVNDVSFRCNQKDSCFQTRNGQVAILRNIVLQGDEIFFIGYTFQNYSDLYEYPFPSSDLGIVTVDELGDERRVFPLRDVYSKCWLIPDNNSFACFPLLHSVGFFD